jgi:hypothetical protein
MIQRSHDIAALLALVRTGGTTTATPNEKEFADQLAIRAGVTPPSQAFDTGVSFGMSYLDYLAQQGLQALRSGQ